MFAYLGLSQDLKDLQVFVDFCLKERTKSAHRNFSCIFTCPIDDHPVNARREPFALAGWIHEVLRCDPKESSGSFLGKGWSFAFLGRNQNRNQDRKDPTRHKDPKTKNKEQLTNNQEPRTKVLVLDFEHSLMLEGIRAVAGADPGFRGQGSGFKV